MEAKKPSFFQKPSFFPFPKKAIPRNLGTWAFFINLIFQNNPSFQTSKNLKTSRFPLFSYSTIHKSLLPRKRHDNGKKQPFEDLSPILKMVIFQLVMLIFGGVKDHWNFKFQGWTQTSSVSKPRLKLLWVQEAQKFPLYPSRDYVVEASVLSPTTRHLVDPPWCSKVQVQIWSRWWFQISYF